MKYLFALGIALAMGLPGCTTPPLPTVWPEPRALGKMLPTSTPPLQPLTASPSIQEISEPTGVLTLLQAQTLAVQHNPKLAAFGWEVRAGEARTLQAGLPPNPEVEIEVENFAGSGELQGFQSAEITIRPLAKVIWVTASPGCRDSPANAFASRTVSACFYISLPGF